MATHKVKAYLQQNKIHFSQIPHPLAYSARETSHVSQLSEKQFAKTVIIYIGNKLAMVVVPSNENVDFEALKKSLHNNDITLDSESDFSKNFPDCELGAMPPFGNLYGLDVYVEQHLANNKEIAFNAGSHTEMIKLAYQDFEKLVKPKVIAITH